MVENWEQRDEAMADLGDDGGAGCLAGPGLDRATAQALSTGVDAYGTVFDECVKKREPKSAVLAVCRGGKTVFAKGHGADPLTPTLIAACRRRSPAPASARSFATASLPSPRRCATRFPSSSSYSASRPMSGGCRRPSRSFWCTARGCAATPTTIRST
ncbi:MAG: hypothetical protein EXQ83_16010, partial [Xanthobacteraceae bacterium]|nr:hypothetical protein [Xanthobacteraceae bacterium]